MSYSQKIPCSSCKGKGAKPRSYERTSNHYLCDECFIRIFRNLSRKYGIKSIHDELKELKTMQDYLHSRSLSFEIPHQAIFDWIADEMWSELTNYRESIKPAVKEALDQQWKEHIATLEEVPDKIITDIKIFDERRKIINNRKKWWETNYITNDALLLLERTRQTIASDEDLLAKLRYFKERATLSGDLNHTNDWKAVKGLRIFISGRITDLEEERDTIAEFLEKYGADVTRFELVSSDKEPFLQCREWARDCEIYIGIYGTSYGHAVENDLSATEIEFNVAKENNKPMIIAIKKGDKDESQRKFINQIRDWESGVMAPPFNSSKQLLEVVQQSLQKHLTKHFRK